MMKRSVVSADAPDAAMIAEAAAVIRVRVGWWRSRPTRSMGWRWIRAGRRGGAAVRVQGTRQRRRCSADCRRHSSRRCAAGDFGPRERALAEAFWPGPLSIVVPAGPALSRAALGGHTTVAIRVPAHAVARAAGACIRLLRDRDERKSVRRCPPLSRRRGLPRSCPGSTSCSMPARAPGGPPSTIVALDEDGPVLVRAGAIAWDRVIKSLQ